MQRRGRERGRARIYAQPDLALASSGAATARAGPRSRRSRCVPRPDRVGRVPPARARDLRAPAQDGVHEPGVAQRARGRVSGEPRAVDLDLRRLPRRSRDQRDHPRAGRRRRSDRPRAPRDPGKHVHDGRLEHARPELLRHVRREPLPRLGDQHRPAPRPRRPRPLRELRLRVDPRAAAALRPRRSRESSSGSASSPSGSPAMSRTSASASPRRSASCHRRRATSGVSRRGRQQTGACAS